MDTWEISSNRCFPSLPLVTGKGGSLVLAEDFITSTLPQSRCLGLGISFIFIFPCLLRENLPGFYSQVNPGWQGTWKLQRKHHPLLMSPGLFLPPKNNRLSAGTGHTWFVSLIKIIHYHPRSRLRPCSGPSTWLCVSYTVATESRAIQCEPLSSTGSSHPAPAVIDACQAWLR